MGPQEVNLKINKIIWIYKFKINLIRVNKAITKLIMH